MTYSVKTEHRFRVLVIFKLSDDALNIYKFSRKYLEQLQNYEAGKIYDGQTDRWDGQMINIKKTLLYNSDPLKPHFYIVKLWFRGVYVYIIFLILLKNKRGYCLELPH